MIEFMITAPSSNTGKTAVTCGLLSLFERRGFNPCAFKCGPDYIDPMFHKSVMGIRSSNLDVFLAGEDGVKTVFRKYSKDHDAAICEGVMGYYDGRTVHATEASAWHVATLLDIPAILVVRPKGSALTLAAVIKGLARFRDPSRICGVIFNDCSETFYKTYAPAIGQESGIPVLGYLPHMEEAGFESRHLGLMTAEEIDDLSERIIRIGRKMDETIDLDRLIRLTGRQGGAASGQVGPAGELPQNFGPASAQAPVKIAVARDAAFNFIYDETLASFAEAGAEIAFFSPLSDSRLPDGVCGMYLPGGYPELYGKQLEENLPMKAHIRQAIASGMPTIAECGGFLYLSETLRDDGGRIRSMVGALPGNAADTGHLVRFGYGYISAGSDSMLLKKGDTLPVHEFHYWDSTEPGSDMHFVKASGTREWEFGYATDTLYAGFPHLYPAGNGGLLSKRFVAAAAGYRDRTADPY